MEKSNYLFQKRKISFTKRLFKKGINAASYLLLLLKEQGEFFLQTFLDGLPNTYPGFAILKDIFGYDSQKPIGKKTIKVNLSRLGKQGLIMEDPKREVCFLTEKGKEMVDYIYDRYAILDKPWDRKIRIIIFDIPEKKKEYREWLRSELFLLEFKSLQKSVYIGKHPLPKSFYRDINDFQLNQYICVFTVGEIDREKEILGILEGKRNDS